MKKILLFTSFFCCFAISVIAQSETTDVPTRSTKAVYGEFGGSGLVFSANFDSRFKGATGLGFRVGIGGAGGTGGGILTFPIGLNLVTGKSAHHFETGVSFTLVTDAFGIDDNESTYLVIPHFGYRYSKPSNSLNARIYVGPLIGEGFVFFPFGGLSVGYTLK